MIYSITTYMFKKRSIVRVCVVSLGFFLGHGSLYTARCPLKSHVDLRWVSLTTKPVCYVFTQSRPQCLLSSSAEPGLPDNKHLLALTDHGIYDFIKVWFGDILDNFPSGGHFELFCALSTHQTAMTSLQQQHLGMYGKDTAL